MQILQVGNNVLSTLGGMPQAIYDFRRAAGGTIISFTAPDHARGPDDGVIHVPQANSNVGRLYGWAPPRARRVAERHFRECDVVIIHGLFRHHYQWAVEQARIHARPYAIVPHGALDPSVFTYRAAQKKLWWRWVGRPALRGAAAMIFITARERDKAAQRATLPASTKVVYLPVDLPQRAVEDGLRTRTRAGLGIGESERVLLFLGRLDPIKRVPRIIAAFNRVHETNLRLIVAGPDHPECSRAHCAGLVAKSMGSRVHFTGPVYGDQKRALLAAADGFVSASARENFGYSLCEALAAGMPAVIGPGNDLGPELGSTGCAWLLERDDEVSLAAAFDIFARAPRESLQAMGARGRAWVADHLGLDAFRASLSRSLAEITASRP